MPQEVIDLVSAIGAQQRMPLTLTFADRHGRILKETLDDLAPEDMPDSNDEDDDYHPDGPDDDDDPADHLDDTFLPEESPPPAPRSLRGNSLVAPRQLFP